MEPAHPLRLSGQTRRQRDVPEQPLLGGRSGAQADGSPGEAGVALRMDQLAIQKHLDLMAAAVHAKMVGFVFGLGS